MAFCLNSGPEGDNRAPVPGFRRVSSAHRGRFGRFRHDSFRKLRYVLFAGAQDDMPCSSQRTVACPVPAPPQTDD